MRHGFDPCVGKIPWRRSWQSTPIFLPGESHGQRSLMGYSPEGGKQSDTTEVILHSHFPLLILGCCSWALSSWGQLGAPLRCSAVSHCGSASWWGAQAPGSLGSAVASQGFTNCGSQALEHRLSSCGPWTLVACSMWNPLGSGTKPMSSVLVGRLLSTVPPGKSKPF